MLARAVRTNCNLASAANLTIGAARLIPTQHQISLKLLNVYTIPVVRTKLIRRRSALSVVAAVKKLDNRNVVCCKTLVAKPDAVEHVRQLCQQITEFSKDQQSISNNGILSFECVSDQWDSHVFYFWERYESNIMMGRHNTTDEFKKFMEEIQEHLESPIGLVLYEWRDGKIGPPCVQGGPKGEGGLDDATGAGGRFMKQNDKEEVISEKKFEREIWGINLSKFGIGNKNDS